MIVAEQRAFFYPRLEKLAIVLKENGFNDNGDNINDSLVLKDLLPYTTGEYNVQMDMWRE